LQIGLCKEYNINPIEIRKTRFHEFCILVDRTQDRNSRENKKYKNGKLKKRANDNWF
jgi:hypothetical protein